MQTTIRQALLADNVEISAVLNEAACWLHDRGMGMWRADELLPSQIAGDVANGQFFVAQREEQIAGVIKFQLEDELFWPDVPHGESAFAHRLAVRRKFAGTGVSTALLSWAAARARSLDRKFLRLDCEATRPRLRQFYEAFGFRHHSNRQVGPYFVSRYEYPLG